MEPYIIAKPVKYSVNPQEPSTACETEKLWPFVSTFLVSIREFWISCQVIQHSHVDRCSFIQLLLSLFQMYRILLRLENCPRECEVNRSPPGIDNKTTSSMKKLLMNSLLCQCRMSINVVYIASNFAVSLLNLMLNCSIPGSRKAKCNVGIPLSNNDCRRIQVCVFILVWSLVPEVK